MQWVVGGKGAGYGGLRWDNLYLIETLWAIGYESLRSKASPQNTLACIKNELLISWQNRDCDECTPIQAKYTHVNVMWPKVSCIVVLFNVTRQNRLRGSMLQKNWFLLLAVQFLLQPITSKLQMLWIPSDRICSASIWHGNVLSHLHHSWSTLSERPTRSDTAQYGVDVQGSLW